MQVSENVDDLFGRPAREMIGSSLDSYLCDDSKAKLNGILDSGLTERIPTVFSFQPAEGGRQVIVHPKSDYLIFEIERYSLIPERHFTKVFQEIKHSIALIEQAGNVRQTCQAAIRELKKISGFDGVLMYKFDTDWNGTVIAEEKDQRLEPYLGQTFPASDIPKQARDLYLKNPYRLIPDRNFTPVSLYPVINPMTNSFIDLSDCNLRSVPAVHLEYMKNMGVKASMSVRVLRNGRLWGLISCHNIEPVEVSFETCSVFELLSSVISHKIASILNKEEYDYSDSLQIKKAQIVEQIYAAGDIIRGITEDNGKSLLALFDAGGAVVSLDGKIETIGIVPDSDAIENLVFWLEGKNIRSVFATDNLLRLYDDASEYSAIGSGLLAIPIDHTGSEYIICFRPEIIETINWGGNPNEAITFEKDGKNYHPRNSFKQWQQQVRNTALPWQPQLLETAELLRSFLFEFRTRQIYN